MLVNELRITSAMMASGIAIGLGFAFHQVPAPTPAHWWPYALAIYVAVTNTLLWTAALSRDEFSIRMSGVYFFIFAATFSDKYV